MQFNDFKPLALRTEVVKESAQVNWTFFSSAVNLAIAAAIVLDQAKKNIYYGKEIDGGAVNQASSMVRDAASIILFDSEASKTEGESMKPVPGDLRILHAILGKFTEAGELLEAVTPALNGEVIDVVNLAEELGDDAWYTAQLIDAAGLDNDNILETVIAKLQKRYPEKFTEELANNRDLAGERAVLEANAEVEQPQTV